MSCAISLIIPVEHRITRSFLSSLQAELDDTVEVIFLCADSEAIREASSACKELEASGAHLKIVKTKRTDQFPLDAFTCALGSYALLLYPTAPINPFAPSFSVPDFPRAQVIAFGNASGVSETQGTNKACGRDPQMVDTDMLGTLYPQIIHPELTNIAFQTDYLRKVACEVPDLSNMGPLAAAIVLPSLADGILWVPDLVLQDVPKQHIPSWRQGEAIASTIDALAAARNALVDTAAWEHIREPFAEFATSQVARHIASTKDLVPRQAICCAVQGEKFSSLHIPSTDSPETDDAVLVQGAVNASCQMSDMKQYARALRSPDFQVAYDHRQENHPDVSVVVPIYNVEKYLDDCLNSLTGQTLDSVEVLCIVDGSTDSSLGIALQHAANDPRIAVFTQKNLGISAARNHGMDLARGRYLYFMDSDDMLKPHALKQLRDHCDRHELDLAIFDADCLFENEVGDLAKKFTDQYHRRGTYPAVTDGTELFLALKERDELYTPVAMHIARRSYLCAAKLRFREGVVHEDNAYTIAAIIHAQRCGHVPEAYYIRRYRANSIMTKRETFRNAYGYFCAYRDMIDDAESSSPLQHMAADAYRGAAYRRLLNAIRIYANLNPADRMRYWGLPEEEYYAFHVLVASAGDFKAQVAERQRKLQKTYDEKRDRGIEIKRLLSESKRSREECAKLKSTCRNLEKENTRCASELAKQVEESRKTARERDDFKQQYERLRRKVDALKPINWPRTAVSLAKRAARRVLTKN